MLHTPQARPAASCWRNFSPQGSRRGTYRLSLLALVGDAQSEAFTGPVAELGRVPLALTLSDARRPVGRDEVGELSEGMLAPSKRERRD